MTATVLIPSSTQQSLLSTSRVPGSVPGAGSAKMKEQELCAQGVPPGQKEKDVRILAIRCGEG